MTVRLFGATGWGSVDKVWSRFIRVAKHNGSGDPSSSGTDDDKCRGVSWACSGGASADLRDFDVILAFSRGAGWNAGD